MSSKICCRSSGLRFRSITVPYFAVILLYRACGIFMTASSNGMVELSTSAPTSFHDAHATASGPVPDAGGDPLLDRRHHALKSPGSIPPDLLYPVPGEPRDRPRRPDRPPPRPGVGRIGIRRVDH